jgi:flagellar motor switch protein FliG
MCTKWFSDGAVHKYFNPYGTPYDAFINYMNVLSDFIIRVDNAGGFTEELNEIKESASKLIEKGKKFLKVKADAASKQMEKVIQKGKEIQLEDIKEMSDDTIKKLVKEIDIKELAGALKDAEKELVDKIIPNLEKKAKKTFNELQKEMKAKKSDIKKYREAVEKKLRDIL